MVGMPLVLRDEENYRKFAELYGRTVDDGVFSWDGIDISAGYCLVLTEIGNRIDEGVNLAWKNRVYPVWVSERMVNSVLRHTRRSARNLIGEKKRLGAWAWGRFPSHACSQDDGAGDRFDACFSRDSCPSAGSQPAEDLMRHSPMEVSGINPQRCDSPPDKIDGGSSCYSQEFEDTIRAGVGLGIHLEGFENQVRLLIDGEGDQIVSQ
ncbi:hypothetical protein L1987_46809 [Smallanthus sonchifolius]|uniref:Uncharacterized protein n=1 Tax=Smallanthus sonchifolius TaxID=185202 RepID=A0ACB9G1R4_9ASTR|nr:hypothetical protein L1987_46809 [Smallanthus sonchifolius]